MGLKKSGLFFLLLYVQLHPLPALPRTSLPNPLMTLDFNQEQNVGHKGVPQTASMSRKLGDKQNIRAVNKRGGGGHGGGGHGGGGRAGGGGGRSPRTPGGGVVTSHPRNSHSNGSNGGILNYVSLHYLILAFFVCFFFI